MNIRRRVEEKTGRKPSLRQLLDDLDTLAVTSLPDTLDDALDWINSHPHPLALYIFAEDRKEQNNILDHTQSGGVTINATLLHIAQDGLPFGGVGASGMGAYHGRAGFERFTHARAIFRTGFFNAANWLAPPYGKRAKRLLRFLLR